MLFPTSEANLPMALKLKRLGRRPTGWLTMLDTRAFMPFKTIRSYLLAIIGSLGLLIITLGANQFVDHFATHREAQEQLDANIARTQIARAALALSRERDATFLALTTGTEIRPETTIETDRSFLAYQEAVLKSAREADDGTEAKLAALFLETLPRMRADAIAAMTLPLESYRRQDHASRWFGEMSLAVKDLRAVRLRLLNKLDIGENLFSLYYLRTLTLILLDEIMKNGALLELEIAQQNGETPIPAEPTPREEPHRLSEAASNTGMSVAPFEEFLSAIGDGGAGSGIGTFDARIYGGAEATLRQALLSGDGLDDAVRQWRRVSHAAILQLDELQATTFRVAQERVAAIRDAARTYMIVWGVVLCATAAIIVGSVWVVFAGVVAPLERMRTAMIELANDNLNVRLPKPSRLKEIGSMDDALRVFKANATRRRTLQREQLKLHDRLEATYAQLKADLEAAAAIQTSLLPQQVEAAGITFSSYFRPSHFLAGDTFDVVQQPDGRVIVFQIDVAGHGAAAALVSVASKYTVAQAILQRRPGAGLAEVVQDINREWPNDLPYFTLLLAEIDPRTGQSELVQAGHPSPILLCANGDQVVLGDGGLPIGALAHATFDAVPFFFAPNDRLIITTDGVLELENRKGEPFSEARLKSILLGGERKTTEQIIAELDTSMRSWRGDDSLDDDVTVVILEGKRIHEY